VIVGSPKFAEYHTVRLLNRGGGSKRAPKETDTFGFIVDAYAMMIKFFALAWVSLIGSAAGVDSADQDGCSVSDSKAEDDNSLTCTGNPEDCRLDSSRTSEADGLVAGEDDVAGDDDEEKKGAGDGDLRNVKVLFPTESFIDGALGGRGDVDGSQAQSHSAGPVVESGGTTKHPAECPQSGCCSVS